MNQGGALKIAKRKILMVLGTRPDAIKMCPVALELQKRDKIDLRVCSAGQHWQMLNQVLDTFKLKPDYSFNITRENQTPFNLIACTLKILEHVLKEYKPDIVLIHGDTCIGFATSIAAFFMKVPIGHVEAGLRTNNIYSPFPEEYFRQAISIVTQYYFVSTKSAAQNLLWERYPAKNIYITGNTATDALRFLRKARTDDDKIYEDCCKLLDNAEEYEKKDTINNPYSNIYASERIADILEKY